MLGKSSIFAYICAVSGLKSRVCFAVLSSLQRRYPRFVSSAAAEKGKKTKAQQLDLLIRRLPLTLSQSRLDAADASFPPAELCALLGDAMRCAAADVTDAVDADVEERLVMRVREGLVARAKGAAEEVRRYVWCFICAL